MPLQKNWNPATRSRGYEFNGDLLKPNLLR